MRTGRQAVGTRRAAPPRRDDSLDAEAFQVLVERLAIVSGVGQEPVEGQPRVRLADDRPDLHVIGPWTPVDQGGQEQVGGRVDDDRQFRVAAFEVPATPRASNIVDRDVTRFQAGRVDGGRPRGRGVTRVGRRDQALAPGEVQRGIQEAVGAPFFRSRRSA